MFLDRIDLTRALLGFRVVARKFALFKSLRLALKAVPGQAKAITAPFPKDGRRLKKASTESNKVNNVEICILMSMRSASCLEKM